MKMAIIHAQRREARARQQWADAERLRPRHCEELPRSERQRLAAIAVARSQAALQAERGKIVA